MKRGSPRRSPREEISGYPLSPKGSTAIFTDRGSFCAGRYHFLITLWRPKTAESRPVKYWEIITDNLSKAGGSGGCVSAIDSNGRTIWIADAHRGDGPRSNHDRTI